MSEKLEEAVAAILENISRPIFRKAIVPLFTERIDSAIAAQLERSLHVEIICQDPSTGTVVIKLSTQQR